MGEDWECIPTEARVLPCGELSPPSLLGSAHAKAYFGDVNALNKGKDYVVRGRPWERYSDL